MSGFIKVLANTVSLTSTANTLIDGRFLRLFNF
jgi:hypothetical protein